MEDIDKELDELIEEIQGVARNAGGTFTPYEETNQVEQLRWSIEETAGCVEKLARIVKKMREGDPNIFEEEE